MSSDVIVNHFESAAVFSLRQGGDDNRDNESSCCLTSSVDEAAGESTNVTASANGSSCHSKQKDHIRNRKSIFLLKFDGDQRHYVEVVEQIKCSRKLKNWKSILFGYGKGLVQFSSPRIVPSIEKYVKMLFSGKVDIRAFTIPSSKADKNFYVISNFTDSILKDSKHPPCREGEIPVANNKKGFSSVVIRKILQSKPKQHLTPATSENPSSQSVQVDSATAPTPPIPSIDLSPVTPLVPIPRLSVGLWTGAHERAQRMLQEQRKGSQVRSQPPVEIGVKRKRTRPSAGSSSTPDIEAAILVDMHMRIQTQERLFAAHSEPSDRFWTVQSGPGEAAVPVTDGVSVADVHAHEPTRWGDYADDAFCDATGLDALGPVCADELYDAEDEDYYDDDDDGEGLFDRHRRLRSSIA